VSIDLELDVVTLVAPELAGVARAGSLVERVRSVVPARAI
jgi:hypothetical protein